MLASLVWSPEVMVRYLQPSATSGDRSLTKSGANCLGLASWTARPVDPMISDSPALGLQTPDAMVEFLFGCREPNTSLHVLQHHVDQATSALPCFYFNREP